MRHRHLILLSNRTQAIQSSKQLLFAARLTMTTQRRSRLIKVATTRETRRAVFHTMVLARQKSLCQRRVCKDGEIVLLAEREDRIFDDTIQQIVGKLVRDHRHACVEDCLHIVAAMIRNAHSSQRSFFDELLNHRHVDRGRHGIVRPVDLQQIDVVRLEILQRVLERPTQIIRNQTITVRFRCNNIFITVSARRFQRVTQCLLSDSVVVRLRSVKKVNTNIKCILNNFRLYLWSLFHVEHRIPKLPSTQSEGRHLQITISIHVDIKFTELSVHASISNVTSI